MKEQIIFSRLSIVFYILLIGCNTVEKRWQNVKYLNAIDSYEAFIRENPESEYSDSARIMIMEINYIDAIQKNTVEAFELFILKYPESSHTSDAKMQHEKLLWELAVNEHSLELYEKYLTAYPNGNFAKQIRVEFTSEWFSRLPDCVDDLFKIPENTVKKNQNTIYTLKSFSSSGPEETRKMADGSWGWVPSPKRGPTVISGTVQTYVANVTKDSYLKTWNYIYSDSSRLALQGWAVGIPSGELVFPMWVLDGGPNDRYIENNFEIAGFCNDCFLVILNPQKDQKIFIEMPQYGLPYFTLNYPGTKVQIGERIFIRKSDGWYFSIATE
jgi:hypothetical protein